MDIAVWQMRLENTFLDGSEAHGYLLDVLQAEERHRSIVNSDLSGHLSLIHSLLSFLHETFSTVNQHQASSHLSGKKEYYPFLFEYVAAYRTIRASETLLFQGYPETGYSIMRSLKDRVLFLSAIGLGLTSTTKLLGLRGDEDEEELKRDTEKIRRRGMREEQRVLDAVFRNASSSESHRSALLRWERLFNKEIHGAKLSSSHFFLDWYHSGGPLPLEPKYEVDLSALYLNRIGELGWMLTRLLPLLQPVQEAFGSGWSDRWRILDKSFQEYNAGLTTLGKDSLTEIANAIAFFVENQLHFSPELSSYQSCQEGGFATE